MVDVVFYSNPSGARSELFKRFTATYSAQQVAGSMLIHSTENADSIDLEVMEGIIAGRLDSKELRARLVEKFMAGANLGSSTRLAPVIPKQVDLVDAKKGCPDCGCVNLVRLSSQDLKLCPGCGATFSWALKPGQVKTV